MSRTKQRTSHGKGRVVGKRGRRPSVHRVFMAPGAPWRTVCGAGRREGSMVVAANGLGPVTCKLCGAPPFPGDR